MIPAGDRCWKYICQRRDQAHATECLVGGGTDNRCSGGWLCLVCGANQGDRAIRDRVKVLHVTKSGRAHATAESDDHLIVPLSDFTSKETRDGKTEVLLRKKGQAYWRQGGSRAYDTSSTADMIVVDLKPGQGTTIKKPIRSASEDT